MQPPKMSKTEVPPTPTGPDTAQLEADERQKLAQRNGRMATIFAGSNGVSASPGTTTRGTLLGQSVT